VGLTVYPPCTNVASAALLTAVAADGYAIEIPREELEGGIVVLKEEGEWIAEAPLADIQACADCIVSFRNQGGFSIVAPGFPGNVQVKGVVEIQVR
jgi:hypothetical protein